MTNSNNLLTGSKLEYRYQDGSIASIIFADESLDVEWLSGPFKGAKRTELSDEPIELFDEATILNFSGGQ